MGLFAPQHHGFFGLLFPLGCRQSHEYRNFSIEITQTKPGQRPGYNVAKEENDDVPNAKTNKDSKHHKSVVEKDAASLTTLKESIDKVRNGPACLPSVCFYTFQNAYQG